MAVTINTESFNLVTLNVYNPSTSAFENTTLTGNLYTVAGITDGMGHLRKLSIGELVMAVCLARAQTKESAVISLMATMNDNTTVLEALTEIEDKLIAGYGVGSIPGSWTFGGNTYNASQLLSSQGINPSLNRDNLISEIESKMDSLNSFSQQKMIELQSETNKRDQAYDLISNVLKSLNAVQVGNANNI